MSEELKMTPGMTLAFFASVIKSGEPWTGTCQKAYDEAMAALRASPTPPTTEGRGTIPFDKTDLAQLQQVREELRNRWRASAWQLLCRTIDDLESRASSPRVEDVRREVWKEAARIAGRWCLKAPDGGSPSDEEVDWGESLAAHFRSLSPPDGDGKQEQARPSGSAPISTLSKDTTK